MSYSEWLQQKHNDISPEVLDKLDNIWSQISPEFILTFEEYRSGVLKILKENKEYAEHPIVKKAIEEQNSRLLKVLSRKYKKNEITWAIMEIAVNDDLELKIAA